MAIEIRKVINNKVEYMDEYTLKKEKLEGIKELKKMIKESKKLDMHEMIVNLTVRN